jgi:two-component system chemotaxis response regulator CheY
MNLRALVLDDSRIMRNMVKRTLQQTELADFEFTEANDGAEGLSLFEPSKFDSVVADWKMPNMSGIDFVQKIRSDFDTDHIPIVMITSEKTLDKVNYAIDKAGVDAFISKPFTANEIKFKLTPVLESLSEPAKQNNKDDYFGRLLGGEK